MDDNERRYQISKRERAVNRYQTDRNRSATLAACLLAAGGLIPLANGVNIGELLRLQLEFFSSFDSVKEYFQMVGPVSTFLQGCATVSFVGSVFNANRARRAQADLADFNNAFDDENNNNNVYRRQ